MRNQKSGELRISSAHNLKLEKYQHFSTDILRLKTTVTPFEIGSNTGYISRENKENIKRIHKYCKRVIKLKNFKKNISAIAVLGSYYIFNSRSWSRAGAQSRLRQLDCKYKFSRMDISLKLIFSLVCNLASHLSVTYMISPSKTTLDGEKIGSKKILMKKFGP